MRENSFRRVSHDIRPQRIISFTADEFSMQTKEGRRWNRPGRGCLWTLGPLKGSSRDKAARTRLWKTGLKNTLADLGGVTVLRQLEG